MASPHPVARSLARKLSGLDLSTDERALLDGVFHLACGDLEGFALRPASKARGADLAKRYAGPLHRLTGDDPFPLTGDDPFPLTGDDPFPARG